MMIAMTLREMAELVGGTLDEVDDPEVGRIRHVGTVLDFSATPGEVQGPTSPSGAHTAQGFDG